MSLLKALKRIDEEFDNIYSPVSHHRVQIKKTAMEVVFNWGWSASDKPHSIRFEWFPPQDRYCLLIDVNGTDEFIYNSWNLQDTSLHNWNEDFAIEYDIERSFFDCLPMAYPMTTNFKYEHVAVLKSISDKYAEKKIIYNMK